MSIEKTISPFIQKQFPSFYNTEGPNFIAFVQAYYEWMESNQQTLYYARSLPDLADVDRTLDSFLEHFRTEYLNAFPTNAVIDKRLMVKHALELYRSKGTPRAYQLLFRLLFNEDIEINALGNYLFTASEASWVVPKYIEVSDSPFLPLLVKQQIYNTSKTATAIVESVARKNINNKIVNLLYITSPDGRFKYGEKILCETISNLNPSNAPTVLGSLTAIAIENGGLGFSVGDILSVQGTGYGAKARVAATINENGRVTFNLLNGGSGFNSNANITVATTINLTLTNSSPNTVFSFGDTITDTNTHANGMVTFANSSFVEIINFSPSLNFTAGDYVNNQVGTAYGTISGVFGGGGSGAGFNVGGITNQVAMQYNTDNINSFTNTLLDNPVGSSGYAFTLNISTTANTFTAGNTVTASANTILLEGIYLSSNNISNGEILSNTSLGISGLYVYKSDLGQLSILGNQANLVTANSNISNGTILVSSVSSSKFQVTNYFPSITTVSAVGNVYFSNSTVIRVSGNGISNMGSFLSNTIVTDTQTGHTAQISNVNRNTNWGFLNQTVSGNLDAPINQVLQTLTEVVGTITYLSNQNPGNGYTTVPYIDINQTEISQLRISDGNGGMMGHNAIVDASVLNANGIITAVDVYDSGIGFDPDGILELTKEGSTIAATGTAVIALDGFAEGYWNNNKSFISDTMKIQDSYYYQKYSYEILAQRMKNTYEKLVKDLIHPAGLIMFGKYRYQDNQTLNETMPEQLQLTYLPNNYIVQV